ncbi:MAG: hypothetical protein AAFU70_10590, partial [Planctomycetota bacterium]
MPREVAANLLNPFRNFKLGPKARQAELADTSRGNDLELQFAASVAVVDAQTLARVVLGASADIDSGGDVFIDARSSEQYTSSAKSEVTTKAEQTVAPPPGLDFERNDTAVSVAVAWHILKNEAEALVLGGAAIDAVGDVTVSSLAAYPQYNTVEGILVSDNLISGSAEQGLNLALREGFGTTRLFNSWTTVRNDAKEGASAFGGFTVSTYDTTSRAIIGSGAMINQDPDVETLGNVSVTADTDIVLYDQTGNFRLFSLESFFGELYNKGLAKAASKLQPVSFGKSKGTAVGGLVALGLMDNTTHALIEGGAAVASGAGRAVTVRAEEDVFHFQVTFAGNTSKAEGGVPVTALSGAGLQHSSDTIAGVGAVAGADSAPVGATITAGTLDVDAISEVDRYLTSGGFNRTRGASTIGLSVAVNTLDRRVEAFVGAAPALGDDRRALGLEGTTLLTGAVADWGTASITADTLSVDAEAR